MSRTWVTPFGPDWVMVCDQPGCTTRSETFPTEPALELFQGRGWFIGWPSGDRCPDCLAKGLVSKAEPYRSLAERQAGERP